MNELDLILTWINTGIPVRIENQEVYNGLTNYISELVSNACIEGDSQYQLDEIASIYFSVEEANYGGEFDLPLKKHLMMKI